MLEQTSNDALVDRPCPICSTVGLVHMGYPSQKDRWKDLSVLVCDSCGFGFVPDVPFDLNEYYVNAYGDTHGRKRIQPSFFENIDQKNAKKIRRSKAHADLLFNRFGKLGSVLDIGSGPGFFTHYVKADRKFAIESDTRSHEMLRATGATVVSSPDEVDNLDAVVMSHVLEHFLVDDYRDYLKTVFSKLNPGGVLLIEVPECPNLNKKFERKNGHGHEPHTMFFSAQSLVTVADAELIYFHNKQGAYPITDGRVDWSTTRPKECAPSAMMGLWRKY